MNLEEQIKLHKALSKKIEEMEEQRKDLSFTIMQAIQGKTQRLAGYLVRCCSRLSIKLSIEEARSLNAIKLEETIDKDKIKALYKSGHPIDGVSEIQYIQISSLSSEMPEDGSI